MGTGPNLGFQKRLEWQSPKPRKWLCLPLASVTRAVVKSRAAAECLQTPGNWGEHAVS